MSRPRPLWVKPSFLVAEDFLDEVDTIASEIEPMAGQIGDKSQAKRAPENRVSSIRFLDVMGNAHVAKHVFDITEHINAEFFGFDISSVQALQHTTYERGAFYKPHIDVFWETNEETSIYDRKLSVSVLLNDPAEFSGGELIIEGQPIEMERGSVVVFPSYVPHEVTKVTKGMRRSLVSWIWGSRWR